MAYQSHQRSTIVNNSGVDMVVDMASPGILRLHITRALLDG